MYQCVWCGHRLPQLYKEYGVGSVSLSKCPLCKTVADPYIDYDWVLVALDLALLKREAFSHVLFNRSQQRVSWFELLRFFCFVLIVQVFVNAAKLSLPTAPALAWIAVEVATRNAVYVFLMYLMISIEREEVRTVFSSLAPLHAYFIGSLVPLLLSALTIVWDYAPLEYASIFQSVLLIASRSLALNVVLTDVHPTFSVFISTALFILTSS